MRYLLYGIVQHNPAGCYREPGTCLLTAHGLAAAVSAVEEISSPPSISSLLAFERVVEAIHSKQAIIPLRYGGVMDSESAVIRFLEDHRQEYEALLARLLGMTEMAIRVLWPARAESAPGLPEFPGAAYLASLRNRYDSAGALVPEETRFADQVLELLSDCFTEQRKEVSASSQGRIVSLYFLTPRGRVERFRNDARQVRPPAAAKLLVSGPWPPYNFVTYSDRFYGAHAMERNPIWYSA